MCIDEYQRLPDVLDAIKARLNREGSAPGVAVITGSTRRDALPTTAQALTGRLHSVTIWPLSQGEIAGVRENLLQALWADAAGTVAQVPASSTTRAEYVERACAGGLPMALRRNGSARSRWFDDFIRQSIERDAQELRRVRERQAMADLLTQTAARTGQLLNISKVAEAIGVSRGTTEGHLRLLETFVVGELRKQASWSAEPVNLGHWRTSDGAEADVVVEYDDGSVVAFEVKAGERAPAAAFRGLEQLREALGSRFIAGVVLTTGRRSYTYSDRLHVMPVDRLWQPVP